jgi:hypothetical protein
MARRTVYDTAADKALKELKTSQAKRQKAEGLIKRALAHEENLLKTLLSLEPLIGRKLIDPKKAKRGPAKNATEAIDRILERKGALTPRGVADEAVKLNVFPEVDDKRVYQKTLSILRRQLDEGNYRMWRKSGSVYYDLSTRVMGR